DVRRQTGLFRCIGDRGSRALESIGPLLFQKLKVALEGELTRLRLWWSKLSSSSKRSCLLRKLLKKASTLQQTRRQRRNRGLQSVSTKSGIQRTLSLTHARLMTSWIGLLSKD